MSTWVDLKNLGIRYIEIKPPKRVRPITRGGLPTHSTPLQALGVAGAVAPSVRQPFSYVKGGPNSRSYVNTAFVGFGSFWQVLVDFSLFWLARLGSIVIGMGLFGWFWPRCFIF